MGRERETRRYARTVCMPYGFSLSSVLPMACLSAYDACLTPDDVLHIAMHSFAYRRIPRPKDDL